MKWAVSLVIAIVLFHDTWSQKGHSMSCMTILFLNLQITRSVIRPHIKWEVSLVIALVTLIFLSLFYLFIYFLTFIYFTSLREQDEAYINPS